MLPFLPARKNILTILTLFTCITAFSQRNATPRIKDKLEPAEAVVMTGFVGQKLDASFKNRILAQDVTRLIEPFKHRTGDRCWQSEFWG